MSYSICVLLMPSRDLLPAVQIDLAGAALKVCVSLSWTVEECKASARLYSLFPPPMGELLRAGHCADLYRIQDGSSASCLSVGCCGIIEEAEPEHWLV